MLEYEIQESPQGHKIVRIFDEDHGGVFVREFYLDSVSVYRELLGLNDPLDALKAIIRIQDNGVPPPEGEHSETVFSDLYQLLTLREQEREHAAKQASQDNEDVIAASQVAAFNAVHQPINGGECALDRARRSARERLGVDHPESSCRQETKTEPATIPDPVLAPFGPMTRQVQDEAILADSLQGQQDYLLHATQDFLHGLSGNEHDPIAEPRPAPSAPPSADEIMGRIRGEA